MIHVLLQSKFNHKHTKIFKRGYYTNPFGQRDSLNKPQYPTYDVIEDTGTLCEQGNTA